jgi:bifunctional DNA-binding transcriptional regulator/antitoxin component of YhaV-PrlF toxin-antitoxin module
MHAETKVTDANQTQVPAEVRAKHKIGPGDLVVWDEAPDGSLRVSFRRRHTLRDMVGFATGASDGDSVEAKRRAQRRE